MGEALKLEKRNVIERFGLEAVPKELRTTSGLEYAMIQIAVSVNAGNFLVPALAVLEGGLSFYYAVLATVTGAAMAFLFVSFLALPGAKYGIPAQYAIRSILGVKGARYIASPVRTLTSLYWFSVQTIGGTYLLKELIERFLGYQVSFLLLALSMATLMAVLALIGFEAVKRLTKYFLPILFLGGVVMLYIFITTEAVGVTPAVLPGEEGNTVASFVFFASLAFVQYVSGVSSASDMARYGKTSTQAYWGLYSGNVLGFFMTAVLGAYTATLAGSWNPYVVATQMTGSSWFIAIIFLAAIVSMISINLSNAYTGGYSLLNMIPKLGRVRSAVIFGIVAIILSAFPSLVNDAKVFISYLGALIIPLSAVIVSDFILVKKCKLKERDFEHLANESYSYNKSGLISTVIGVICYLSLPESLSPGFITFIVTGVLYFALVRRTIDAFNK